jgi:glycosyltransferase involved in cell wall biosynthesis
MTSINDRIAVVFESFVRAGSQRHLLEILKAIRLFRPDLECSLFLIAPPCQTWGTFLPEVYKAEIPVIQETYVFSRKDGDSLAARAHNWWSRHHSEHALNQNFYDVLDEYSVVVCAQPFVADLLLPHLRRSQRFCFHLMEHVSQRTTHSHYKLLRHPRVNTIFMHASQVAQLPLALTNRSTLTWPVRLCPDHFTAEIQPVPKSGTTLRLAHYSRISPMRHIDQVIRAFALLHHHIPATLRIAGHIEDPTYHQALLTQIAELGIEGAVSFVDPVPVPAEDPARDQVDLVWMISLSGHIGFAALEAMAAGFPTLLLEVDTHPTALSPDPESTDLICATPQQLVQRSLALQEDPAHFREQQSHLMRQRFLTTKDGIQQLVDFYLGHR